MTRDAGKENRTSPRRWAALAAAIGLAATLLVSAAEAVATPTGLDRLVYSSNRGGNTDIWAADVDGANQVRLTADPAHDTQPDVSPDGTKIVFVRGVMTDSVPEYGHLWVMDADGGNPQPIFTDPTSSEYRPDFSPDGTRILFSRFSDAVGASSQLWVVNADGTGLQGPLVSNANYGSWSPDGTKIVHVGVQLPNIQIWVTSLDGSGSHQLTSIDRNVAPQWSPDGTRIAFTSFRNGDGEVFVMNADGSDQHLVAASPGKDGLVNWSPDSARIAFGSTRHTPCRPELTELCPHQIFTISADGTDLRLVADNAVSDMWPAYFPRPLAAPSAGGERLMFSSNRAGTYDISTRRAPMGPIRSR